MRNKIKGTSVRPRFYVFRSNKHIYVQIIDDTNNTILTSSSSISQDIKINYKVKFYGNCKISKVIGHDIANKALKKGITQVVFDRGHKLYHGRIKALAEAAREQGIKF